MSDAAQSKGGTQPEFYLTLFEEFPALVWRSNVEGECDWFNNTWLNFTGRTMAQEYGSGWTEGVHPDDLNRCVDIWTQNFAARSPFEMEYRLKRHDGEYRWIRDFGRPFNNPSGEFYGFIGACYDVTDMRLLTAELAHMATHDALTGLPNRRAFETEVVQAIAFAGRGRPSTVLFTDVDGFKVCNDTWGHTFGDGLLKEIGHTIQSVVRDVDLVARIGGDEFGVLLRDRAIEDVEDVCARLQAAVASAGKAHGADIGLSIGKAAVTADAELREILSEADTRMYEVKREHN